MPRKNEPPTQKEIYQLWWEYLKRSKRYKKLCQRDPKSKNLKKLSGFNEVFAEDLLFFFGDIHSVSFDEWWKERESWVEGNSIENYIPILGEDIAAFVEEWNKPAKLSERKSLKKEIENFLEDKWLGRKTLYWMITIGDPTNIDNLLAEIKNRLEQQRKELLKADEFGEFFPTRFYPTQPIRIEELKRYLEVYDFWNQGKKWNEIATAIYPKRRCEESPAPNCKESLQRSLFMDLHKAKEVISNVEGGVFPGRY